jgi:hypothetical protein
MTSRWSKYLSPTFIERHESAIVFFVLGLFLAFNVATAPFSPDAWNDEVSYSEPAATLAATGYLASHAWSTQGEPVWTGNAPLHQLLLAGFIKIFGFSSRTVRGVNMLYYTIAVLFIYQIVRKYNLVRQAKLRLLLVAVLLAGTGLVALYRNGRYDAIGALLVILWAWFSLASGKKPLFLAGTFLVAILMPTASLSIAPFLVVSGLTAFCLWRWKSLYALGVTGIGCLVGMGIMQVVYSHFGVPHIFHKIMKSSGGRDVAGDFILSVFKNPSYIAAVAAGCLLIFPLWLRPSREDLLPKKIALALFSVAVIVPFFMGVVAKYHLYYTWMAIIPGTICAFMVLEFQSVPKSIRTLALALVLVATLPGFPRRCIRVAGSWAQNRPQQIANAVRKDVSASDIAFVDERSVMVYYGLLPSVRESYWFSVPSDERAKAAVNVVFWPEAAREKEIHDLFGGEWRQTGHWKFAPEKLNLFSDPPVQFAVYRKN